MYRQQPLSMLNQQCSQHEAISSSSEETKPSLLGPKKIQIKQNLCNYSALIATCQKKASTIRPGKQKERYLNVTSSREPRPECSIHPPPLYKFSASSLWMQKDILSVDGLIWTMHVCCNHSIDKFLQRHKSEDDGDDKTAHAGHMSECYLRLHLPCGWWGRLHLMLGGRNDFSSRSPSV